MRIQHGYVVGCHIEVVVCNSNEHRAVDSRVTSVGLHIGLYRVARRAIAEGQCRVRDVQLRSPCDILRASSVSTGNVAIVRTNMLAGGFPRQENLAAGPREGSCAVMGDRWVARFTGDSVALA